MVLQTYQLTNNDTGPKKSGRLLQDCFPNVTQWNINGIENDNSLLNVETSRKVDQAF